MKPEHIFSIFLIYTLLIFFISWITGRKSDSDTFYIGKRQSPWYIVAYGMIGASLSGVTFISVPGDVGNNQFTYMLIVLGYLLGYVVIAQILLPLYYRLKLTSIYTYLEQRFGPASYKTGASYFLLSRIVGASFRMFLVINVLHEFVFKAWNIPFAFTVILFVLIILLYTFKGGIKTIVWTDTLQTTFMLLAVIVSLFLIGDKMQLGIGQMFHQVWESQYSDMVITDFNHSRFFLKQIISGMFITIVMTGLDQDMMQKNLSCKNIREARKNMYWLSISLVPVNLLFLLLGGVLFIFASNSGLNLSKDEIFPAVAITHLGPAAGIIFIIGLIAAAYSSADSALTSLTTSFSIDILNLEKRKNLSTKQKTRIRHLVHLSISILLIGVILIFKALNDDSVINNLFKAAGYTYGPLLGMYAFGLFTKLKINDKLVPLTILSPVICYFINQHSEDLLKGYKFGFELLIINGIISFLMMLLFHILRKK